jgi:lycopene cyclase domain-containing protein
MDRFQYLLVMGLCVLATLPLELVFGARVYRRPRRLLATLACVAPVFFIWDLVAVARDHWTFSPEYTTGWTVPGDVPVEEVVFFVVIPICALLTRGAVQQMLDRRHQRHRRHG